LPCHPINQPRYLLKCLAALLQPSFPSSSPATVGSARPGAVKEISAGWARPGPARLDGTRAWATVADKVM